MLFIATEEVKNIFICDPALNSQEASSFRGFSKY